MTRNVQRGLAAVLLAVLAGSACAHTGHDTTTFQAGLAHPFAADHLLAMLAVGLWSVTALPASRAWMGPAAFLAALAAGAAVGTGGAAGPLLETAVAGSLVLLGALLVAGRRLPPSAGLALVTLVATLHGLAHGAEAPSGGGWAGYAAGFLLASAALHAGGVCAGLALRRAWALRATQVVGGLGAAFGSAGLVLLGHL